MSSGKEYDLVDLTVGWSLDQWAPRPQQHTETENKCIQEWTDCQKKQRTADTSLTDIITISKIFSDRIMKI
jgi:hypothetical protein